MYKGCSDKELYNTTWKELDNQPKWYEFWSTKKANTSEPQKLCAASNMILAMDCPEAKLFERDCMVCDKTDLRINPEGVMEYIGDILGNGKECSVEDPMKSMDCYCLKTLSKQMLHKRCLIIRDIDKNRSIIAAKQLQYNQMVHKNERLTQNLKQIEIKYI
jgi:enolase